MISQFLQKKSKKCYKYQKYKEKRGVFLKSAIIIGNALQIFDKKKAKSKKCKKEKKAVLNFVLSFLQFLQFV